MSPTRSILPAVALALALGVGATGCGGDETPVAAAATTTTQPALERAKQVEAAVGRWAGASTLAEAKAGAEEARNLITGPHVPGSGDGDRDGTARTVRVGLLPGADGSRGLASDLTSGCPARDVLGGSWADPSARWRDVLDRIAAYSPANNEFPGLASHAQRTVGWASLTLAATTLAEAREYAGHATGHARIVTEAIANPSASPCPGA